MVHRLLEWIGGHMTLVEWLAIGSLLSFVGTLIVIPILIAAKSIPRPPRLGGSLEDAIV